MSKFVISDALGATANARSVVNFKVSILSQIESSQIKEHLGTGDLWLNILT